MGNKSRMNLFSFVQMRRYGGFSTRSQPDMWRAQFSMLRMNMAWSLPGAFPWGSKGLKDVFLLSHDTFCVVWKNGSGDVFAPMTAKNSL